MPEAPAGPDTIRVLIATDNHVGYNERDAHRGNDSANTFDEIMCLAKNKTVDMVLLAGDLFHDNNPSRKSLNAVMRSLRVNCFGDKPCELEALSDPTEHSDPTFQHLNYEDLDINVAIPVFSIHGNHDDPSGAGHLAALDLLQTCGLINYYGRTPESDNITIKPVLLQKGHSKLALYGMSNVRDERLYRTFRDKQVTYCLPKVQKENWFNLLSVHQNHVQHTARASDFLPEDWLPDFADLIVWGHEHECKIEPRFNPVKNFKVMQPGSSIATSLMPGEAVEKHVAIVEITGKEYTVQPIRLKTVRPFVMREIVLRDEPGMEKLAMKENNRTALTDYLSSLINELINEARQQWHDAQDDGDEEGEQNVPLPLIRLRVEYSAPEGGRFDLENPQRFSNRFQERVANVNDVVQFYKKKTAIRKSKEGIEEPEESKIAQLSLDTVKVERLVREFLTAQNLTILPQNLFGDAVSQFVDKDDRHAMESFVLENLGKQVKHLLADKDLNEDDLKEKMEEGRSNLERLFEEGHLKNSRRFKIKPRPAHWDSDRDGPWEDAPGALVLSDGDADMVNGEESASALPQRLVTRSAGGKGGPAKSTRKTAAATVKVPNKRKAASAKGGRSKKTVTQEEESGEGSEEESDDVIEVDDDEEEEVGPPARSSTKPVANSKLIAANKPAGRATRASQTTGKQMSLNFSQSATRTRPPNARVQDHVELSDDEIDDDAFEPTPAPTRPRPRR